MNLNALTHQTKIVGRRWWLSVSVGILAVMGVVAWRGIQSAQLQAEQAEQVALPEIITVTALGHLEPEGEIIQLTAPTSAQESRVQELLIDEGDQGEQGQVRAGLDNRDLMQAALQIAEQEVQIARAQLAQVQ
ncbi:MAG: HlyD family secretion protein, partial [Leptolyngbyaceae cyanobacterium]